MIGGLPTKASTYPELKVLHFLKNNNKKQQQQKQQQQKNKQTKTAQNKKVAQWKWKVLNRCSELIRTYING